MRHTKTIGIWGLGIVGSSLAKFCSQQKIPYITYDQKNGTDTHAVATREDLFKHADIVIPSPGINAQYLSPQNFSKLVAEIDFFFQFWKKPVITITGTLGKTSTTVLITQALQKAGVHVAMGGNIGTGMFDLFEHYKNTNLAVLELSSYQLEHAHACTPDLSIITNLYPNHLDRHTTVHQYAHAKFNSLHTHNLVHATVLPYLEQENLLQRVKAVFCAKRPDSVPQNLLYFYFDSDKKIILQYKNKQTSICPADAIPTHSFAENWLCVAATLWLQGYRNIEELFVALGKRTNMPDHRMQKVGYYNNITYINDSKATLMESVFAALEKLDPQKTILLLGGLSKGVNRIPLLKNLKDKARWCICFGTEATELHNGCIQAGIPSAQAHDMQTALMHAHQKAVQGDTILLSPGGSSFDLFDNFEQRGAIFTQLVEKLSLNKTTQSV